MQEAGGDGNRPSNPWRRSVMMYRRVVCCCSRNMSVPLSSVLLEQSRAFPEFLHQFMRRAELFCVS